MYTAGVYTMYDLIAAGVFLTGSDTQFHGFHTHLFIHIRILRIAKCGLNDMWIIFVVRTL